MAQTAQPTDLVDIAYVKQYFSITTENQDDKLQALVSACSIKFASECNRTFGAQTVQKQLNGTGGDQLQLIDFPLTAVNSLQVQGVIIPAASAWNTPGYFFDTNGMISLVMYRFVKGRKNIAINYTFGYPLSGTGANQPPIAAPADIVQAVAMMVGYVNDQSKHIQQTSENLGGMVAAYDRRAWPAFVQATIEQNSRVNWTIGT